MEILLYFLCAVCQQLSPPLLSTLSSSLLCCCLLLCHEGESSCFAQDCSGRQTQWISVGYQLVQVSLQDHSICIPRLCKFFTPRLCFYLFLLDKWFLLWLTVEITLYFRVWQTWEGHVTIPLINYI